MTKKHQGTIELIELLFFAYRDFVADADRLLADYRFGRAHHRVLHFVDRRPGLTVAALLDILQITKQSLNRVLKDLLEQGFIEQQTGPDDRRQRLLQVTKKGRHLAQALLDLQIAWLQNAMTGLDVEGEKTVHKFLSQMQSAKVN